MGRAVLPVVLLAACYPPFDADPAPTGGSLYDITELDDVADGARVTVRRAVVTTGRTADDQYFFAQADGGGVDAGLRVGLRGELTTLPPPIGTPVWLRGIVHHGDGPTLDVDDIADVGALGPPVDPVATPWDPTSDLMYALVYARGAQVTSPPDPAGHADTSVDVGLDAAFVDPPGWQSTGDITGVVTDPGRVSLRGAEDWTGSFAGASALPVEIADLATLADGTLVRVEAVQATPWSLDHRHAVVQDATGGVWVDAEGWGDGEGEPGDRGTWTGEVRSDGEGLRLRSWWSVAPTGYGTIHIDAALADGAYVRRAITVSGGPDDLGRWPTATGEVLCDRFTSLDGLAGDVDVEGPVRVLPDGVPMICPVPGGS